MKKLLSFFLALAVSAPLLAQKEKFNPSTGALLDGKTIIKANLTSPFLNGYAFSAERILTKGLSLQVGVAKRNDSKLPFSESIEKELTGNKDFSVNNLTIGSFAVTPELRWYTGGNYGKGFYLMAYYRYQKYTMQGLEGKTELSTTTAGVSTKEDVNIASSGDLTTKSFGAGFGVQWFLGKKKNIVLDWNILGAHYGKGTLNLSGTFTSKKELSKEQLDELEKFVSDNLKEVQKLQDTQVKGVNVEVNAKDKKISVKDMSTPWAWLRTSLSIGIRF